MVQLQQSGFPGISVFLALSFLFLLSACGGSTAPPSLPITPNSSVLSDPIDISQMTGDQIVALTPQEIGRIIPSQMNSVQRNFLLRWSHEQVQALLPTHIEHLKDDSFRGCLEKFTVGQFSKLSLNRLQAIIGPSRRLVTNEMLEAIPPEYFPGLSDEFLWGQFVSPSQISKLTGPQLAALTDDQWRQLPNKNLIQSTAIPDIIHRLSVSTLTPNQIGDIFTQPSSIDHLISHSTTPLNLSEVSAHSFSSLLGQSENRQIEVLNHANLTTLSHAFFSQINESTLLKLESPKFLELSFERITKLSEETRNEMFRRVQSLLSTPQGQTPAEHSVIEILAMSEDQIGALTEPDLKKIKPEMIPFLQVRGLRPPQLTKLSKEVIKVMPIQNLLASQLEAFLPYFDDIADQASIAELAHWGQDEMDEHLLAGHILPSGATALYSPFGGRHLTFMTVQTLIDLENWADKYRFLEVFQKNQITRQQIRQLSANAIEFLFSTTDLSDEQVLGILDSDHIPGRRRVFGRLHHVRSISSWDIGSHRNRNFEALSRLQSAQTAQN